MYSPIVIYLFFVVKREERSLGFVPTVKSVGQPSKVVHCSGFRKDFDGRVSGQLRRFLGLRRLFIEGVEP